MKNILHIAIFLIAFGSNAQNITMLGRYTFYQCEDSVATFSLPQSKTIYNEDYEVIYESYYTELGDSTADVYFEYVEKSPEVIVVKGFISKGDTSRSIYTEDCERGEKLLIVNGDTTFRYRINCIDNEVVRIVCTQGDWSSDTLIKNDGKEFWEHAMPNGRREYSMMEFDQKERLILSRWGMSSMTDTGGNFMSFQYNDDQFIETITSSTIGVEDRFGTIVINYCDKNWIAQKREVIELNDGVRTLRRFEYTRVP